MAVRRGRSTVFVVACSVLISGCSFGSFPPWWFAGGIGPHESPVDELIERASCASVGSAREQSGPSAGQEIRVVVRPTAIVDLVGDEIAAATTNTGCAPQSSDDLFARYQDGTIVELSEWTFGDVVWIGDFTQAGVSVSQISG